jgi:3D (Asp-Asp-Asp) domain-containing protein
MTSTIPRRAFALTAGALLVLFVFVSTSRDSTQEDLVDAAGRPRLGTSFRFAATAYCKGETTAAGTAVRTGMAAADPALLPLGSVIRIENASDRHDGIWTVMDTGPAVQGREVDLYMWSCHDALAFGRRDVRITILRLGWDPQQSAPATAERLFRQREQLRPVTPAAPSDAPAPAATPAESPAVAPTEPPAAAPSGPPAVPQPPT